MESDQLLSSFVKVLVSDAERSARFYEALGFKRVNADPPFIQLRWENQAEVYLVAVPPALGLQGPRGVGVLLGFRIGAVGLEEVASRARAQGATVDGPTVQPWFTREIVISDPDGYRLNFIEPA
ncbi:VOC family protein [Vitiosangium sp. GDMCC 1.1324]|uniref:VOC family protein n=1 Tax=Vitiosangium sp. (strain GDMCC 1.1324) TaxID=2138576 RepID=UPI000D340633|nr:VOC family protein [Vitiosangium sp. GDMCC 1.1324]PTL77536.1 VOC family protein [Vitiosangium sp. GDMCC 1.1324]